MHAAQFLFGIPEILAAMLVGIGDEAAILDEENPQRSLLKNELGDLQRLMKTLSSRMPLVSAIE
jgi:hypothetical protein